VAIANVAAITTDLNCSVTFTILYLYSPKHTANVTNVAPSLSHNTRIASKMAETPPINKPSNNAYPELNKGSIAV
jgi:hypothetical protein